MWGRELESNSSWWWLVAGAGGQHSKVGAGERSVWAELFLPPRDTEADKEWLPDTLQV